ncbi:peptide chain release factor N(5)-glutamine methyltransferase [Salinimicrobium sp. HB62]|uniref:peptide chain release factor N(5)-glutamine methyltransferase n=1 Tax=Salinimicrobium sp. HB62 TaxID=3077781 RepID=UPI002D78EB7B|nr:peptide chain release factor N(5)-glutamine methyltransferase [Salinimicrobium sp. HB62]
MKITAFKNHFFDTLAGEYSTEEIGSFFNILAEDYLSLTRLDIALRPDRELSEKEIEVLTTALQRLKLHEPIQYITGHTEFFGLDLQVNRDVLIPRPETEELVEWMILDLTGKKVEILDIGTGSGCIAIALAKNLPEAKVTAVDISPEALAVAKSNARKHEAGVNFLQLDILATQRFSQDFDVIVSNPPYVRELEKEHMQRNVLEHEPKTALYVKDEDPLLFYNKITTLAAENLPPGGKLFFEINQYLGKETETLLQKKNFQTTLKKDIFGAERMLKGVKA